MPRPFIRFKDTGGWARERGDTHTDRGPGPSKTARRHRPQDAIDELKRGVPELQAALVKAQEGLRKKLALYEKRNKAQALERAKGSSTPVAASASSTEARKPRPSEASARAASLLADHLSIRAGAVKSMAAAKLLNHRLVERKDDDAGSIRGVVKLRPADDSAGEVQFDVKWTGVNDSEVFDWACTAVSSG